MTANLSTEVAVFRRILFISVWLMASCGVAMAQSGAESGKVEPDVWMPKRQVDWGLAASFGRSHGGNTPERNLGEVAVTVNRVLTNAVGPGFLRGRMAVTVELIPLFLTSESSTTYGAGFNLLGRHYLDTRGAVRPFITMGAGMIVSEDEIPTGSAKLNFTPQIGLGLRWRTSAGRILTFEYRFHHLSNAGRVKPNPGINSSVVQFGFSFTRSFAE